MNQNTKQFFKAFIFIKNCFNVLINKKNARVDKKIIYFFNYYVKLIVKIKILKYLDNYIYQILDMKAAQN